MIRHPFARAMVALSRSGVGSELAERPQATRAYAEAGPPPIVTLTPAVK